MPTAGDAYDDSENTSGFRSHLGASFIGRECPRELWYTFRWVTDRKHQSKLVRLFNRGHLEEPRFVALLRMIGCEVWQFTGDGKQFRISKYGGHFGGSLDAVIRGCPDVAEGVVILGEFKTSNDKSFTKLLETGVRQAKPEHFAQMQIYMEGYALPVALYMAVNKDNEELYGELVPFEPEIASYHTRRAFEVINSPGPLPKINENSGWYKCKFCDHRPVCHLGAEPARNCRTCVYSRPLEDGTWQCAGSGKTLSKQDQLVGCKDYRWIPI